MDDNPGKGGGGIQSLLEGFRRCYLEQTAKTVQEGSPTFRVTVQALAELGKLSIVYCPLPPPPMPV